MFDKADIPLDQIVVDVSELPEPQISEENKKAFDVAYENIYKFHEK